jgi:hypothetical protein
MASRYKFTVVELAAVLTMLVKDRNDGFDFGDWDTYAAACKVPFTSLQAIGDHLWNLDCSALSSPSAIDAAASDVLRLMLEDTQHSAVSSSHTTQSVPEASMSCVVPTNSTANAEGGHLSPSQHKSKSGITVELGETGGNVLAKSSAIALGAPESKRPHRDSVPRVAKKFRGLTPTVATEDLMSSGSSELVYVFRFLNETNTLCWLNCVIG